MSEVTFIRRDGRVIPIRKSGSGKQGKAHPKKRDTSGAAAKGAAVAGAGLAADAARTRTVFKSGQKEIIRKRFTVQPFALTKIGSRMDMFIGGKKAGTASYYLRDRKDKTFSFSWLGTKRQHRGKGVAKQLTHHVAKDMKAQGGKSILNQVVHPKSLQTNYNRKRDTLWHLKSGKKGLFFDQTTKKAALKNIRGYRNKKGILTSDIHRETSLKGVRRPTARPYMNTATRTRLGVGLAVTGASIGYLAGRRKED